ncbi:MULTISPECIES: 16S rRNA (uracil(1498)-N(3))-methyltransferase [unclassified Psychrobacter]|uniref:16S rRNA (uracil(1498)-N(3))-methyltransferase n=1 Tax=unclassified Psychrobacter TaxID=196806 RepID=UPI00071E87C6|nr:MULTISPECIES: 16S rRNA (uracil(1498)-N(3))-methyltransferase [unclassified Psychrobacter]OLF38316.1 16S rRNA (uracil(1498)-N(3))-methyltransferase [Psychrobacter sp. Cmf 22.2]
MRRFFYATSSDTDANYPKLSTFSIGTDIALTESIVHHWGRVLRANVGDEGILFDGFGGEYHVKLQDIGKKNATVTLLAHIGEDRSAPIHTKIGLVMSRGDRMDYAIQKATELGVTGIQLLSSHHGEVNLKPAQVDKKLLHWQQVAIAASEQCGLNRPPLIFSPISIHDWLQGLNTNTAGRQTAVSPIVTMLNQDPYYQILQQPADLRMQLSVPAPDQPAMPESLLTVLKQELPYIELIIGPEGGLSEKERKQAVDVGFIPWQIGIRVLRTETAPVVALATLHALYHPHK